MSSSWSESCFLLLKCRSPVSWHFTSYSRYNFLYPVLLIIIHTLNFRNNHRKGSLLLMQHLYIFPLIFSTYCQNQMCAPNIALILKSVSGIKSIIGAISAKKSNSISGSIYVNSIGKRTNYNKNCINEIKKQ